MQDILTQLKQKDLLTTHARSKEKWIAALSAAFEGIGLAGLVSAALWYTEAPMAPDGFTGPISTFIIALTALISLLLALPMGYVAYQKNIRAHKAIQQSLWYEARLLQRKDRTCSLQSLTSAVKCKFTKIKHITYGCLAGITCAEVLLGIGWTILSILIGIHVLSPIAPIYWLFFASFCVIVGTIFGIVIYMQQQKEALRELIREKIRHLNRIHTKSLHVGFNDDHREDNDVKRKMKNTF